MWEHLEVGYVQGMCDLLAPLLVILDDGKQFYNLLKLFFLLVASFVASFISLELLDKQSSNAHQIKISEIFLHTCYITHDFCFCLI